MSAGTLQCSIMHACMLQSLLSPQGVTASCTQASANISRVGTEALHVAAYSNAAKLIGAGWQH